MKDYFSERLRHKGKAEEDRYFAEHDRLLIETLRHRSQSSGTNSQSGTHTRQAGS